MSAGEIQRGGPSPVEDRGGGAGRPDSSESAAHRVDSHRIDARHGALVVADLHLDLSDDRGCDEFARACDALSGVAHLVVLGDLFDAWVGPAHARLPAARTLLAAFARLSSRGVAVHLVHGNRDFLVEESTLEGCGARVHPDHLVARSGGLSVLLVHGDRECTRDHAYQRLRRVLRSPLVRALARRAPLWASLPLARRLRRASRAAVLRKPLEEKSIQPEAIRARAAAHGADVVVCGHAHAWRDEDLGGCRWIVLDAWRAGPRDWLRIDGCGLHPAPAPRA